MSIFSCGPKLPPRKRKKLQIEIETMELYDTMIALMDDWRFGEAIEYIKAIQRLQLSSWMYSLTIANYVVCLVRLNALSTANEMHEKLLEYYEKVLTVSPRDLLTAAEDTLKHSKRPLRAALFYHCAARISTKHGGRSRAVRNIAKCAEGLVKCIENVAEVQCSTAYLQSQQRDAMKYLISVLKDVVNCIDEIPKNGNLKGLQDGRDFCHERIQEAENMMRDWVRDVKVKNESKKKKMNNHTDI